CHASASAGRAADEISDTGIQERTGFTPVPARLFPRPWRAIVPAPAADASDGRWVAAGTQTHLRHRAVCVWLPLLLLSALQGHALGDSVAIPFLFDFDVHVRLL